MFKKVKIATGPNSISAFLSSFFGHSRDVRTGQTVSAEIGGLGMVLSYKSESPSSLSISMPHHHPYGILHAACKYTHTHTHTHTYTHTHTHTHTSWAQLQPGGLSSLDVKFEC